MRASSLGEWIGTEVQEPNAEAWCPSYTDEECENVKRMLNERIEGHDERKRSA